MHCRDAYACMVSTSRGLRMVPRSLVSHVSRPVDDLTYGPLGENCLGENGWAASGGIGESCAL